MLKLAKLCFASWLLLTASHCQAAVMLKATLQDHPAPGLDRYIVAAVSDAGEIINSFAGIYVTGVHNVQPPFGQPAIWFDQWATDGANGASLAAWSVYDTHLLLDRTDGFFFPVGSLTETNDGTNPVGLNLMTFGHTATVGIGTFGTLIATDPVPMTPDQAGTEVPFLQIVQPTGLTGTLDVIVYDTTGQEFPIFDFPITIPEPSTLALSGFVLVFAMRRGRRL